MFKHLAKHSYGVYLAHMFVLVPTFDIVSSWGLTTPLTMILSALLTFTITALIIELAALLPKSKYIVG